MMIKKQQALKTADEHKASLENQAVYMVELAKQSYGEHDHLKAVQQALRGYDLVAEEDIFIPGLFQTLVESMGLYVVPLEAQDTVRAEGVFRWESGSGRGIYFLDEKGERLFTEGDKCMYVWDTDTFQCVEKVEAPWWIERFDENYLMERRKQYLFVMSKELACYDYEKGTCVWEYGFEGGLLTGVAVSDDETRIVATTEQNIYVLDAAEGTLLQSSAVVGSPAVGWKGTGLAISSDNKKAAFTTRQKGEDGGEDIYRAVLYDIEKDRSTVVSTVKKGPEVNLVYIQCLFTKGDKLLLLHQIGADIVFTDTIRRYYSEKIRLKVSLYDPHRESFLWEGDRGFMSVDGAITARDVVYGSSGSLLLVYGKTCEYVDIATGETLDAYETDAPFIQIWCGEGEEIYILQNGYLLRRRGDEERLRGHGYFSGELMGCQRNGSDLYIWKKGDSLYSDERRIVKYKEGVFDPGYERCAYMDEKGEAVIERHFPKKGIKKPDKDQRLYKDTEIASGDGRYAAHVEGTSVLIESREDEREIFVRLIPDETPTSLFWSEDADKLLIGYADKAFLYNMEAETLSDVAQLEEADMENAVWMWLDETTAIYVGSSYSYVMDAAQGHFGVLYKLKGFRGYDPEGDEFYLESQIYSVDKLNEGVYYDALEVGRIERYSKEEIIEKAREMAGGIS